MKGKLLQEVFVNGVMVAIIQNGNVRELCRVRVIEKGCEVPVKRTEQG